jgi:hypothetical protein
MIKKLKRSIGYRYTRLCQNRRIRAIAAEVAQDYKKNEQGNPKNPVLLFNASTRLIGLSQNAAFSLLTHWALKECGIPAVQLVCRTGMQPCVLGTIADDPEKMPPCAKCMRLSDAVYAHMDVRALVYLPQGQMALDDLSVSQLAEYQHGDFPVGAIVLPSIRWILRRHNLLENDGTRTLFARYIHSAISLLTQFEKILDETQPRAVVVFNGMFFPEATLKWAAQKRGIQVISHEVALRPMTAFFTPGEATAYPIELPADYQLNQQQNERLDAYLANRMQGDFSMAGVRFWSGMKGLDASILEKAAQYKGIIPVFTNVIFDTSQGHANVLFGTMFDWLDSVAELIRAHPEHLFILRAHPDEVRPGKASQESVADWVDHKNLLNYPNVLFIPAEEPFSSYEMIQRAKFVMVYNSTIGLEASILGAAVVCAGKARFTQTECVYFPKSLADYSNLVSTFLTADHIQAPELHKANARNFLYAQLFETSLPMETFLENDPYLAGYTGFKDFHAADLRPENSETMRIITDGILKGEPFLWQP